MDEVIEMDVQISTETNNIEDVEMKTPPGPEITDEGVDEVDEVTTAKPEELTFEKSTEKKDAVHEEEAQENTKIEENLYKVDVVVEQNVTTEPIVASSSDDDEEKPPELAADDNVNAETKPPNKLNLDTATIPVKINESDYFKEKRLVEIARSSWNTSFYLRGCLWSPDGTCCLTIVNGDGMHLFELPSEFYECQEVESNRPFNVLDSVVHVPEGGTVYDCSWYPSMHSLVPETCCWVATRQHEPIHLWDAFDGKLRCSYRGYNDVDEVESAISVAFSSDGLKIYSGFRKSLKIFNTTVPGKDYDNYKTNCPISSIAINDYDDHIVALGSWNKSIFICDPRDYELNSVGALLSHNGGVTYMKFLSEHVLLSGARKDNQIIKWDLRFPVEPLKIYERTINTNQRIYFDVSPEQYWLTSGDTDGHLYIWNLDDGGQSDSENKITFPVHNDCCNGVSFHPYKKILSTSTGQFHQPVLEATTNGDGESIEKKPPASGRTEENSLIFWWFGDVLFNH